MPDAREDGFRPPTDWRPDATARCPDASAKRGDADAAPAELPERSVEPGWRQLAPPVAADASATPAESEDVAPLAYGAGTPAPTPPRPLLAPPGSPALFDDDVLTSEDDAVEPESPRADRHLVAALVVVSVALVLVLALLISTQISRARPVAPSPSATTQGPTPTVEGSNGPTSVYFNAADNVLYDPQFGTVLLPAGEEQSFSRADDWAEEWLNSGALVVIGTLGQPTGSVDIVASAAQDWAARSGMTFDEGSGAVRTSPLGYEGWCAASTSVSGQFSESTPDLIARGCFYPNSQGSSYVWVVGTDAMTDLMQTLVDSYVPPN